MVMFCFNGHSKLTFRLPRHPQVYGDPADQVTLSHVIEMYGVIPNMTVGDVMNTRGKLCYQYD